MIYYQVIFVDEYNNLYELGFFTSLADAEPVVNGYLSQYVLSDEYEDFSGEVPEFGEEKNLGPLVDYLGTFGPVFDRIVNVEEGCVQVRGFIKEAEDTIEELKELLEKNNGK